MKKRFKNIKEENKKYLKILAIVLVSILFYVFLSHMGVVKAVAKKILSVLAPIIVGLCMAFIFNIPLKLLETKIFGKLTRKNGKFWSKIKRPLCLSISLITVFGLVAVLLAFIIPEFIVTCQKFFEIFPPAMENLTGYINGVLSQFNPQGDSSPIQIDWAHISSWALNIINNNQEFITQSAIEIITGLFTTVVNFVLGLFFSIYLLYSKEALGRLMKSIVYSIMKRENAKKFISVVVLSNKAFTGFVTGQCIEVLLTGAMCAAGMLVFKMPFIVMVSCVVAFTAFVPVFGPVVGTAIGAFLIFVQSPAKAIGFVIMMIVLQQIESNVVYPKIMGKQVGLPGIWVLIAVTIGGGLFGVMGVIISVPTCSVLYTLFDRWLKKRLEERNICHKSMSHDSSEPKSIIEEIQDYQFEKDIQESFEDDFEDEIYTDDGEVRAAYKDNTTKENSTDTNS